MCGDASSWFNTTIKAAEPQTSCRLNICFMTGSHFLFQRQPRGLTLARIEGPVTAGVTVRERGECEITPSTDVRYPPGSTNSQKNHWLLIGKNSHTDQANVPIYLSVIVSVLGRIL